MAFVLQILLELIALFDPFSFLSLLQLSAGPGWHCSCCCPCRSTALEHCCFASCSSRALHCLGMQSCCSDKPRGNLFGNHHCCCWESLEGKNEPNLLLPQQQTPGATGVSTKKRQFLTQQFQGAPLKSSKVKFYIKVVVFYTKSFCFTLSSAHQGSAWHRHPLPSCQEAAPRQEKEERNPAPGCSSSAAAQLAPGAGLSFGGEGVLRVPPVQQPDAVHGVQHHLQALVGTRLPAAAQGSVLEAQTHSVVPHVRADRDGELQERHSTAAAQPPPASLKQGRMVWGEELDQRL